MLAKTASRLLATPSFDLATGCYAIVAIFRLWQQRRRECEELAGMNELELRDLGLGPADRFAPLRGTFRRDF